MWLAAAQAAAWAPHVAGTVRHVSTSGGASGAGAEAATPAAPLVDADVGSTHWMMFTAMSPVLAWRMDSAHRLSACLRRREEVVGKLLPPGTELVRLMLAPSRGCMLAKYRFTQVEDTGVGASVPVGVGGVSGGSDAATSTAAAGDAAAGPAVGAGGNLDAVAWPQTLLDYVMQPAVLLSDGDGEAHATWADTLFGTRGSAEAREQARLEAARATVEEGRLPRNPGSVVTFVEHRLEAVRRRDRVYRWACWWLGPTRVHRVWGEPFFADLAFLRPSSQLNVEVTGPPVQEEQLFTALRQYGRMYSLTMSSDSGSSAARRVAASAGFTTVRGSVAAQFGLHRAKLGSSTLYMRFTPWTVRRVGGVW